MKHIVPFSEGQSYTQDSGPSTTYRTILPREEGYGLNIGYVVQEGPTFTLPDSHDWPQCYLVIKGQGTILLDDEEFPVTAPTLVRIPPHTKHATRVDEGQSMEYTYINQFAGSDR